LPQTARRSLGGGHTSFEWLTGQHFLISDHGRDPRAQGGVAIIGVTDEPER